MDIAAHQGRASPARPARRPVARQPVGAAGSRARGAPAGPTPVRHPLTLEPREPSEQSAPLRGGLTPSRRSRRSQGRSVCIACRPRTDRPPARQSSPPSCQPRSLGTDVVPIGRTLCMGCATPRLGACPGIRPGERLPRLPGASGSAATPRDKKYAPAMSVASAYCISRPWRQPGRWITEYGPRRTPWGDCVSIISHPCGCRQYGYRYGCDDGDAL